MSLLELDTRNFVRATLNYLVRTEKKPYSYTFDPPEGVPARFGELDAVGDVVIRNGRPFADEFALDAQGFALRRHDTAVEDFYNEDEVKDVYYPEVEDLLKSATGAEKVVIFDHTIRSVPKFEAGEKGFREPVRRVHNDYTATSGPRRVRDHLSTEEADARLKRRFWEVNVWRPIKGPLEDAPLAVCDARTIAPDDLIASDLIYPDKVGEIYNFSHNPAHRWFYFPRMQRDEALLIKCFDSDENAAGRFTAHTAFDDPATPENPRPRESIETRALVFFA
jgi:hypothetical protein